MASIPITRSTSRAANVDASPALSVRLSPRIGIAIAIVSGDQTKLTLNAEVLVENLLFPSLDSLFGRCGNVGRCHIARYTALAPRRFKEFFRD
jgi:hypothetical protein